MRHLIGFAVEFPPANLPVFKFNGNRIGTLSGVTLQKIDNGHFIFHARLQQRLQIAARARPRQKFEKPEQIFSGGDLLFLERHNR